MASEMRRAAKALLVPRVQAFESLEGGEAAHERVRAALERAGPVRAVRFHGEWKSEGASAVYEATFAPTRHAAIVMHAASLAVAGLLVASAAVFIFGAGSRALRVLLPFCTLLGMVALPLIVQALAAQREADEARITRAIRTALQDAEESYPPAQRWPDED
ncbi:MAG TPA: hypothetical protein VN782_06050 [Usitatibacter sp.]|nr:hypothetical protein [Usitatibacter sp.]